MAVSATGTTAINNISSKYQERVVEEDPLGKQAFLTMLLAQLKNQDPLNPMDGTDFTAQLAQFTQLEKSMSMDNTLTDILSTLKTGNQGNYVDHIGKTVKGDLNSLSLSDGEADDGYYTLKEAGEVVIAVYDSNGAEVKRLFLGQQDAGTNSFSWNGKNEEDELVSDGTYTYDAYVQTSSGYSKLDTGITGEVTGLTYQDGKQMLEVTLSGGNKTILMSPSSVTEVRKTEVASDSSSSTTDTD